MNIKSHKVALIGGKGIIQAHLRILKSFGISDFFLLSSSEKTTNENCNSLNNLFGLNIKPLNDKFEAVEKYRIDNAFICSSNKSHMEYLEFFFKKNIPVFCEKPLFWEQKFSELNLINKLKYLRSIKQNLLFLNTSNRYFINSILKMINFDIPKIKDIKFFFHTNGSYIDKEIGIDLIPHGLSVLHNLLGFQKIYQVKNEISKNKFISYFKYNDINVEFNFQQGKDIKKILSIHIDNNIFDRIQKGFGNTYKVFIENRNTKNIIEIEDPFKTHIKLFLNKIESTDLISDDFELSFNNMLHMYKILEA